MAWVALAVVAAAGASAYGSAESGRKLAGEWRDRNRDIFSLTQPLYQTMAGGLEAQESYLKQAGAAAEEGYQYAIDDANRAESAGISAVERFGRQALGGVRGSMSSRGFLGSSMDTNARFGVARQTAQGITDVSMAASRLRTRARMGLAQQRAANLSQLGALQAYKASAHNAITNQYWDFLAGNNFQTTTPNYGALGQFAANAAYAAQGKSQSQPGPAPNQHPIAGSSEYWNYGQSVS